MSEEILIKQKIMTRAEEMFNQISYSKVTMEEIAADLGMSKKTLYKHFSNKEHILKEIVHSNKCQTTDFIEGLLKDDSLTFLEKLERFLNYIAKLSTKLENPMIHDLMKCQPEIWKDIDEFRSNHAHKNLSKLIEHGVQEGIFRPDINTDVIVVAYVAAIHSLINPATLAKLPVSANQAYRDIIKILFEGIFTESGREKYNSITIDNYGEINI